MINIKNYDKFIESIFSFKKEAPYYYSDKFKSLLRYLRDMGNDTATYLLTRETDDNYKDDITLIDITDKDDTLSFIQTNRLTKIYDEQKRGSENFETWLYRYWSETKQEAKADAWVKQRTEVKVGKFVTKAAKVGKFTVTDVQREEFVNIYKSRYKMINGGLDSFEIVEGKDIIKWYNEDNYQYRKGQLSNSCMRYTRCSTYFDIYIDNPDVCRLLILKGTEPNKIIGRALVWKVGNNEYYMDRIYTNIDSDTILFSDYADREGWEKYRSYKTYKIKVKIPNSMQFPYMDSFMCLDIENGILTNDEDIWPSDGIIRLQDTSGGYEESDVVWSEYHGEYIPSDESAWCVDINDHMYLNKAIYVRYKNIYVSPDCDDIVYCSEESDYFYIDDTVYSEYLEKNIYADNAVEIYINDDSKDNKDWVTQSVSEDYYVELVNIDGSNRYCYTSTIMPHPDNEGEWIFRNDEKYIDAMKIEITPDVISKMKEDIKSMYIDDNIIDEIISYSSNLSSYITERYISRLSKDDKLSLVKLALFVITNCKVYDIEELVIPYNSRYVKKDRVKRFIRDNESECNEYFRGIDDIIDSDCVYFCIEFINNNFTKVIVDKDMLNTFINLAIINPR